jgi:hypothetical protein
MIGLSRRRGNYADPHDLGHAKFKKKMLQTQAKYGVLILELLI